MRWPSSLARRSARRRIRVALEEEGAALRGKMEALEAQVPQLGVFGARDDSRRCRMCWMRGFRKGGMRRRTGLRKSGGRCGVLGLRRRGRFEIGERLGLMDFARCSEATWSRFTVLRGGWRGWSGRSGSYARTAYDEFGHSGDRAAAAGDERRCSAPGSCRNLPRICSGRPRRVADPDRRGAVDQFRRRARSWTSEVAVAFDGAGRRVSALRPGPPGRTRAGCSVSTNSPRSSWCVPRPRSAAEHERMTACAEEVLNRLGLPIASWCCARAIPGFRRGEDL